MKKVIEQNFGLIIAFSILTIWGACLIFLLQLEISFSSPLTYIFVLLQTHLYTGVFITAHDSIHGTVSVNRKVNKAVGYLCSLLFAYNWYPVLARKHYMHHKSPVSDEDPDYYPGNFAIWYFNFLKEYVTWWQIALMALTYNLLNIILSEANIVFFWMIPAILSTVQLFYFGTYLPHRNSHFFTDRHKARSQKKNHLVAFFTCYFFGYHYEHHKNPHVPWWKLPQYR